MCVKMVVSLGQRGRYTKSASGELDVRRRDLGPALAVVGVAHDLDPLPAELHAVVALLLAAHHGARGLLLKDVSRAELLHAIREVHDGKLALRPAVGDRVRSVLSKREPLEQPSSVPSLTPRELDVLRLMSAGLTNREIADGLGLAAGTVKNHVSVVLGKIVSEDRTRAVLARSRSA